MKKCYCGVDTERILCIEGIYMGVTIFVHAHTKYRCDQQTPHTSSVTVQLQFSY